jgi:tetratricopeptide (TPR) repeat protein
MRHFSVGTLVLIVLAAPLGGCSSFLGIDFSRHSSRAAPEVTPAEALARAERVTAEGRRQLAEGQTGLAIESFQRALANGEPIAPAANGLGVAYARLDRFDLAQRYFLQARASDPANPQYADNLARLMRSSALAMRRDEDIARAALQAAAQSEAAAQSAQSVRAASAMGKLQRVSRGEVRIATAPPQAAPAATSRAKVEGHAQPLIRIVLPESKPAEVAANGQAKVARPGQPLVRIVLPEPKKAPAAPAAVAIAPKAGETGARH